MSLPDLLTKDASAPGGLGDVSDEHPAARTYECDHCGGAFEGTPGGAGLFVWTRGDEVRYEEPPLCDACAQKLSIGALLSWDFEEEEG
jgi:hypothetical protein